MRHNQTRPQTPQAPTNNSAVGHKAKVCYFGVSAKYDAGPSQTDTNQAQVELAPQSADSWIVLCKSMIRFKKQGIKYRRHEHRRKQRTKSVQRKSGKDAEFKPEDVKSQVAAMIIRKITNNPPPPACIKFSFLIKTVFCLFVCFQSFARLA